MDISAITGASGGFPAGQARSEVAAAVHAPGAVRPDTDSAKLTPGQRVDGLVSAAAPEHEVAMNLELLEKSMAAQRYVIDLLA